MTQVRLQKFLGNAGVSSRRQAEDWIRGGHITVNGKAATIGDKVDPDKDKVKAFGKPVKPNQEFIYLALYKPSGYVVTKRDPLGRRTIFSLIPPEFKDLLWNVGRLDFKSEGLLLLTNDGELTQKLSHPSFEHDKEYEVISSKLPTPAQIEKLQQGVEIATGTTYPAKVKMRSQKLNITIHEGKKRQIRRMLDAVGLDVINLKRVRIGKLKLPKIEPGQHKLIKISDII